MSDVHRQLLAGQDRIVEAAKICAALCERPTPPVADALAEVRWRLAREILEHVTFKDRYVYLNLEASADPAVAEAARRLRTDQEALHVLFRDHMLRWSSEAVQCDWNGFRAATTYMHGVLADRLRVEEAQLHPLVARYCVGAAAERQQAQRNWARDSWRIRDAVAGPAGAKA